jgi:2-phosphosulfolactate phosphatase
VRVEVILSPDEVGHHDLCGKTCVVMDVFRFSTTVLTALEAGMERFFPVNDVAEAQRMKNENPKYLLAGERNAVKIPGFDFGNSPLEHYGKSYTGGELVCSTTNGTKAVQAAQGAAQVVLASLRSAQAVAAYLERSGRDVVFLPAGLEGKFSLEDTWCAGLIASLLAVREWDDGAKAARLLYEHTPVDALVDSAHGRRLQALGLWDDLRFCLECSVSPGVVIWEPQTGWGALVRER